MITGHAPLARITFLGNSDDHRPSPFPHVPASRRASSSRAIRIRHGCSPRPRSISPSRQLWGDRNSPLEGSFECVLFLADRQLSIGAPNAKCAPYNVGGRLATAATAAKRSRRASARSAGTSEGVPVQRFLAVAFLSVALAVSASAVAALRIVPALNLRCRQHIRIQLRAAPVRRAKLRGSEPQRAAQVRPG